MHSSNSSCLWSGVYCPQPVLAAISHYPRKSELFFFYYYFFFLDCQKDIQVVNAFWATCTAGRKLSICEQLFHRATISVYPSLLLCWGSQRPLPSPSSTLLPHSMRNCWWYFRWSFLKGELIHDIAKKPSQVTNRIIMENIYKLWLKIHMQAFLFYLLFFYYIPNCWILFHFLYCQTEPPEFSWCYSHCILFRVIGIICFPVQKLKTVLKCF